MASWISIGPPKLDSEVKTDIGLYLAIASIVLTMVIFYYQLKISDNQGVLLSNVSEVMKQKKEFEEAQIKRSVHEIRQHAKFILDDMAELEKYAQEWLTETKPSIKSTKKTIAESYHNSILQEIQYLQSADILSNQLISQSMKIQIKRLATSYDIGPVFNDSQNYMILLNVNRGKSVVITILSLLDDEPNN